MPTNGLKGKTYGVEFSADWQIDPNLRFNAAYSYLQIALQLQGLSVDVFQLGSTEGLSPEHQATFGVTANPTRNIEADLRFRYVGALPSQDIPDYLTADLRIAFNVNNKVELALIGQNLLQAQHAESSQTLVARNQVVVTRTLASQVQRGIFSKVTWNF